MLSKVTVNMWRVANTGEVIGQPLKWKGIHCKGLGLLVTIPDNVIVLVHVSVFLWNTTSTNQARSTAGRYGENTNPFKPFHSTVSIPRLITAQPGPVELDIWCSSDKISGRRAWIVNFGVLRPKFTIPRCVIQTNFLRCIVDNRYNYSYWVN